MGPPVLVPRFSLQTLVENSVKNLDRLHAAGTRCIQLTYNEHNLVGATERELRDLVEEAGAAVVDDDVIVLVEHLAHRLVAVAAHGANSTGCRQSCWARKASTVDRTQALSS